MAVSTANYVNNFFMFLPSIVRPGTLFMGREIPAHVTHTAVGYTLESDALQVQWITKNAICHKMELQHPLTEDSITILLVSMRLSC